jgi:hypothetical protein
MPDHTHDSITEDLKLAIAALSRVAARAFTALPAAVQREARFRGRNETDVWEELSHAHGLLELDILATVRPAELWLRGLMQRLELRGKAADLRLGRKREGV